MKKFESYMSNNYNTIDIDGNKILINGKEVKLPKGVINTNVTQINNKIFVNGYEYKDGKFKRTLRALFHMIF